MKNLTLIGLVVLLVLALAFIAHVLFAGEPRPIPAHTQAELLNMAHGGTLPAPAQ